MSVTITSAHIGLATQLHMMIMNKQDGTIGVAGQPLPTRGYYVGGVVEALVNPGYVEDTAAWVARACQRADYLGVWTDTDGTVYVDASELAYGQGNALELARERGELAVWDIDRCQEIRVD